LYGSTTFVTPQKYSYIQRCVMTKRLKLEGSKKWGVKWSEVQIFGRMCVLSWTYNYAVCMWFTVQYVLSHCFIALCFMSCALCFVLINFLCFYSFVLCLFFVLYVLLSIMCVLCFCNVLCIVSPNVYICLFYTVFVYNFTDHCHRVAKKFQLINITSYHIIR